MTITPNPLFQQLAFMDVSFLSAEIIAEGRQSGGSAKKRNGKSKDSVLVVRYKLTETPAEKEIKPTQGHRFFVLNSRRRIYTIIGATNIHHAYNKATKLYHNLWTSITTKEPKAHEEVNSLTFRTVHI